MRLVTVQTEIASDATTIKSQNAFEITLASSDTTTQLTKISAVKRL